MDEEIIIEEIAQVEAMIDDSFMLEIMHQLEIMAGFEMTIMYLLAILLAVCIGILGVVAWKR